MKTDWSYEFAYKGLTSEKGFAKYKNWPSYTGSAKKIEIAQLTQMEKIDAI